MSTDEIPEPIEPTEEKKRPPFKEGVEWLSDQIDLDVMFRVKGHQGLFIPASFTRKKGKNAGIINMKRFMNEKESHVVHVNKLQGLEGFIIIRLKDDPITLGEALDNLQEYCDNKTTTDKRIMGRVAAMEIICPGHDPDEFKPYHAEKIIKWYDEIVTAIAKAQEDLDEKMDEVAEEFEKQK